ncbi:hypothetical protein ACIGZJ_27845 [Kitasatospora sp. NPDC052868]|uniref:hypothetical protein n=1 Tax=Kitasatospora sp. NPDC052868 TaxID=3364060 RepID=UPI0037C7B74E
MLSGSNAALRGPPDTGPAQAVSLANPLSYQVDARRGLLISTPSHLLLDLGVLTLATALGIASASALLDR